MSVKPIPKVSWHPETGGKRAWVCFEDDKTFELGLDPDGSRFSKIADNILGGDYYPEDAVRCDGTFRDEDRPLQVGDRIHQSAPILPIFGWPVAHSEVEIFLAERSEASCRFGYVTTQAHHGRGIWQAHLERNEGRLRLRVASTACPNSLLYWLGIPVARWLQLRARRRAVEEFLKL